MIFAVDVYYTKDGQATIAGIIFRNWSDTAPVSVFKDFEPHVEPYISGSFYKRELPCILKILKPIDLAAISCIIVDGYVYLADDGRLGLGGYLYEALGKQIPVIGVAKSNFHQDEQLVVKIYRGQSLHPLFITAAGMDKELAAKHILEMSGSYRIPRLLKILDQETRR